MRSTSTATGISLTTLSARLQKMDPSLSLKDARDRAKELIKPEKEKKKEIKKGFGRKIQDEVLNRLFGNTVGGFLSNKITSATSQKSSVAEKLPEDQLSLEKKQKIPLTEVQVILKKLDSIETLVKSIKAIKVEKTKDVSQETPKNMHHEDAVAGLLSLGYKKNEALEMLKNASGTTAAELVKEALKTKNKEAIPTSQVPVAVQAAKESVAPAVNPQTDAAQSTAMVEMKEEEQKEIVKKDEEDKKKILDELKEIENKVNRLNMNKLLTGLAGLLGPLWPILKTISKGLARLLVWVGRLVGEAAAALIAELGGGLAVATAVGTTALVAGAGLVVGGAAALASGKEGAKIKKKTDERLEKFGIKLLSNKEGMTEGYEISGKKYAIEGQTQPKKGMALFDEMSKKDQDIITAYGVENDRSVKAREAQKKIEARPEEYEPAAKVSAIQTQSVPTPVAQVAGDLPEITSTVKMTPAEKLDVMSSENAVMKAEENKPVIQQVVNNDNRTINSTQSGGSQSQEPLIVNVRNMEPTAGAYVASIFNHPVVRLPV